MERVFAALICAALLSAARVNNNTQTNRFHDADCLCIDRPYVIEIYARGLCISVGLDPRLHR